jgi:hypothetical protein
VRADCGVRFIFEVTSEQARLGLTQGVFALMRSSHGDYLERLPDAAISTCVKACHMPGSRAVRTVTAVPI